MPPCLSGIICNWNAESTPSPNFLLRKLWSTITIWIVLLMPFSWVAIPVKSSTFKIRTSAVVILLGRLEICVSVASNISFIFQFTNTSSAMVFLISSVCDIASVVYLQSPLYTWDSLVLTKVPLSVTDLILVGVSSVSCLVGEFSISLPFLRSISKNCFLIKALAFSILLINSKRTSAIFLFKDITTLRSPFFNSISFDCK